MAEIPLDTQLLGKRLLEIRAGTYALAQGFPQVIYILLILPDTLPCLHWF